MATPTCILINGPRGIGKTTAANAIAAGSCPTDQRIVIPVMIKVKEQALVRAGIDPALVGLFEMAKDTPVADLKGKTPREVYIEYANDMRNLHGENHFAEQWAVFASLAIGALKSPEPDVAYCDVVIVPDVRFMPEFYAALSLFKPDHVYVLRVTNAARTNWIGDVGGYLDTQSVVWGHREQTLINDCDLEFFRLEAAVFAEGFIQRTRRLDAK